jgi:hypothetical protein
MAMPDAMTKATGQTTKELLRRMMNPQEWLAVSRYIVVQQFVEGRDTPTSTR